MRVEAAVTRPKEGFRWQKMGLLERVVSQKVEFFLVVGGAGTFDRVPFNVLLRDRDASLDVLTNQACSPVGV